MSLKMNFIGRTLAFVAVLCGIATLAQANSFSLTFDPDVDYPAGAIDVGANLATVSTVYEPAYGISFGEYPNGWDISKMGECCGGNRFLNVGFAPEGRLHWFVNAAPGMYFPAGSTISVDWASSGGPASLKAYGGNIIPDQATVENGNDGTAFGGIIGSVVSAPDQFPTLTLVLPEDAKSFTVHQSAIDWMNDDDFVTGFLGDENLAPNGAINGIRLTVVPEPATAVGIVAMATLLPLVRRRSND